MSDQNQTAGREELVEQIRQRAANLFESHQLLCAPAVLTTLNTALGGGLDQEMAVRISAGLPEGMSGAGCVCGALSGANLAMGLFLNGAGAKAQSPAWARQLHDRFKEHFGSTCCRVISKRAKGDPKARFRLCVEATGQAAAMAADLILQDRPELADRPDNAYLCKRENCLLGRLKRLVGALLV